MSIVIPPLQAFGPEDIPDYCKHALVTSNPQLADEYFSDPRNAPPPRVQVQLGQPVSERNSLILSEAMADQWCFDKLLTSFTNSDKPGYSWCWGCSENWKDVAGRNPSLRESFDSFYNEDQTFKAAATPETDLINQAHFAYYIQARILGSKRIIDPLPPLQGVLSVGTLATVISPKKELSIRLKKRLRDMFNPAIIHLRVNAEIFSSEFLEAFGKLVGPVVTFSPHTPTSIQVEVEGLLASTTSILSQVNSSTCDYGSLKNFYNLDYALHTLKAKLVKPISSETFDELERALERTKSQKQPIRVNVEQIEHSELRPLFGKTDEVLQHANDLLRSSGQILSPGMPLYQRVDLLEMLFRASALMQTQEGLSAENIRKQLLVLCENLQTYPHHQRFALAHQMLFTHDILGEELPNVNNLLKKAASYLSQEHFDQAISCYSRALDMKGWDGKVIIKGPQRGSVLHNKGVAHSRFKQYLQAIVDLTRALELRNGSNKVRTGEKRVKTLKTRGDAYAELGDFDLADADYSKILEMKDESENNLVTGKSRALVEQQKERLADKRRLDASTTDNTIAAEE